VNIGVAADAYEGLSNVSTVTRYTGTTTSPSTGTLVSTAVHEPAVSQLVSATAPRGHTTRRTYDTRGNLSSTVDALGQETRLTYDALGQLVSSSDPLGNTRRFAYPYGNLVSVTYPQGRTGHRFVDGGGWTYPAAPEGARLRFAAVGSDIQVSFDAGATWQPAQLQRQQRTNPACFHSYWTPAPAGTTRVAFPGLGDLAGPGGGARRCHLGPRGPRDRPVRALVARAAALVAGAISPPGSSSSRRGVHAWRPAGGLRYYDPALGSLLGDIR
jgi:YD repeat-containing protein